MARPSHNVDKKMLEVAKKVVCREGCSGIRIRDIADKAHANLGMFHYHFKSKRRFTRVLLQEYYDDFLGHLTSAVHDGDSAVEQLRSVLLAAALFVKKEHQFYTALFKDILNGNEEVVKFVRANFPRHVRLMHELIQRAQKERSVVSLPFSQVMSFLMTSLNFPTLVAYSLASRGHTTVDVDSVISDEAIRQRLDMALKGLKP